MRAWIAGLTVSFDDVPMTIERGCTSETDESLYKCETLDDGSRSCNCQSTGCNSDWKSAESVPCYVCNSSDGIECDVEHHGEEVKCWHPVNRGCSISETVSSGTSVFERSCSDEHEQDGFVCSNTTIEDGSWVHVCKCTKEMGELAGGPCNLDWDTAGEDRPTNPPPKLECYQCDSNHENCSENQMGDAVFCGDEMNGCLISRESSPQGDHFSRSCSTMQEGVRCVDKTEGTMSVHMCECAETLCNTDFFTAGDKITSTPADTSTTNTGGWWDSTTPAQGRVDSLRPAAFVLLPFSILFYSLL